MDYDHIEVLVQPQSLIHSMVEYEDGSVIAQIGNPDMRLPIQFALTYPHRLPSPSHEFVDWKQVGSIITEQPDVEVFRSLRLALRRENGEEMQRLHSMRPMKKRLHLLLKGSYLSFPF